MITQARRAQSVAAGTQYQDNYLSSLHITLTTKPRQLSHLFPQYEMFAMISLANILITNTEQKYDNIVKLSRQLGPELEV